MQKGFFLTGWPAQDTTALAGLSTNTSAKHHMQFVEMAFEGAGMPIRWQGPKGVDEMGVVAEGRTVVTVSPNFFRPVEVTVNMAESSHSPPLSARPWIPT